MRRTILLMATMTLSVLVIGGVAYALNITCDGTGDQDSRTGFCKGTAKQDSITGTSGSDFIDARGGDDSVSAGDGQDTIHGRSGEDSLNGRVGSDTLFGEGRKDVLDGRGGVNLYFGASGPDRLIADTLSGDGGAGGEEIHGGPGNDLIAVAVGLVAYLALAFAFHPVVIGVPVVGA